MKILTFNQVYGYSNEDINFEKNISNIKYDSL